MTNVETTEYKGRVFRRYPDAKRRSDRVYFKCTIKHKPTFLHRLVYEDNFGKIPKGMHVHHKDGNEGNNSPDNLELLTPKQHINEHMDDERAEWCKSNLDKNARPKASEWHKDPQNREHHARIGAMAYQSFLPEDKACLQCNTIFTPKKIGNQDKFCSNKCKSAARRQSGIDNIKKHCEHCGAEFISDKYAKVRFCSRTCSMKYNWSSRR